MYRLMSDRSICEQLRDKRIALHISLREAARFLPFSNSSISEWERGLKDSPAFALRYAQFLDDCEKGKIHYRKCSDAGYYHRNGFSNLREDQNASQQITIPLQEETSAREDLRKKRLELQIGLNVVENALHVSASSISRWERGMYFGMPDFETLYRQFLTDCENGKITYEKTHRVGIRIRPVPKPHYDNEQFSLPLSSEEPNSNITHPAHYSGKIEVIDFIDDHNLNFNLGNVVKYVSRAGQKHGEDTLTALKKAQWYINREIERLEAAHG